MAINDNRCAQCGQRQDEGGVLAPMLHTASRGLDSTAGDLVSYHLDCLPYSLEDAHREQHGAYIDAAKKGLRGDKLRAHATKVGDE